MRALVIEDDPDLREQVSRFLSAEGFAVDSAADGKDGAYIAQEYPADIAVVDLGLPGLSGIELIRQVRKAGRKYPILILTARDGWQSKVEGLEAGADDYLVKPFHKEELLARVRALVRRVGGWAQSQLQSGPYIVDIGAKSVSVDGKPVELTSYEFRVLDYLLTHAGKVISKSELTEHLYTESEERDSNVIEVFIRRLRAKLDPDSQYNPITTLRGSGYRWDLPRA
ncbi:two-component system, OmpR family, response regulator PhoP [Solimonas aquatica]|uniref:Two-component system, OmpR family, response regulator PhoP n=1 Tax=Solimonas aquatica TaxID=489703 RepID=A0A1H8ZKM3_9GAMM|nr:response regulator transcription factor [Solimonas aquatica]SEP64803.1 two-component system, OmpR family, response regulator PhoP [Solimonas aquatica]